MTPNLLDELVPRAWMLRIGDSDVWSYCEQEWMADFYGRKSGTKYEKKPLYDAPALADMAKRMEAAERDAKDAVCVTKAQKIVRDIWETWYPGNEWIPASTTLDLLHQIGNSLLGVPEFERVADSRLRTQLAIDATQEGRAG